MAATMVTATALTPIRHAGRGDQSPPATATVGDRGPGPLSSADLGGECRQVEQVKQGVTPPLPRGPVIEMPEAFVRRV